MLIRKIFATLALLGITAGFAAAQVETSPPTTEAPSIVVTHGTPTPVPITIPHADYYPGFVVTRHQKTTVPASFLQAPIERLAGRYQSGLPFNVVTLDVHRANGLIVDRYVSHNARVSAGANAIAQLIGSTSGNPFNYVALTADSSAVGNADSSCPSEITTGGLARKAATYGSYTAPGSLGASASFQLTATWTATAGATVNKICALNASSSGTLGFETILGSTVTLNSGDTAALTWTFNL